MALTTPEAVRKAGGIDELGAERVFRYADESELDDEVQKAINWAVGWLKARVSTSYYTGAVTTDTDRDELFRGAEEDLALYRLLPRLKIRKVVGTHAPYDQEDSLSFERLIDEEIPRHVEMAIEPFATVDTEASPFAFPVILATDAVDRSALLDVGTQYQALLDESNALTGV